MTGIRTPFDSCGLRPRVPCWHISQPVLCVFVRTYVCVYTGATVGGVSRFVESWLCTTFIVHHPRQCGPTICFRPLSDVRMLVDVVHMNPFLTHMTWPLCVCVFVCVCVCVLGLLCYCWQLSRIYNTSLHCHPIAFQ